MVHLFIQQIFTDYQILNLSSAIAYISTKSKILAGHKVEISTFFSSSKIEFKASELLLKCDISE